MIICFNDKINSFSKFYKNNFSLTQENIQNLMPSCEDIHCHCPNCKAKCNFSYHGSYVRNISFICEDKIYDFKITVTRVICNSCGSTHALLPNFIVPYKIFSRESILYVVENSLSSSVLKIAEKMNLSIQLIYSFITLVLSFFNYADSLNRSQSSHHNFNEKYFIENCLEICDEKFCVDFFNRYIWIFLMTKFQNEKPPPLTIGVNLISST